MSVQTKLNLIFGFLAAEIMLIFGKSSGQHTAEDLKKAEFKTSTQQIGISFTEKIRDKFRFQWLKKI
jgi:hypothetical protein